MANNAHSTPPTPHNEPVKGYGPGSDEKKELKDLLAQLTGEPTTIPAWIDGEKISSGNLADVVCPHDHQRVIGKCYQSTEADIRRAVSSALKARETWSQLPWEERASVFLKAADLITTKYRKRLNAVTMLGQSKTVFQAEIDATCELADFFRFNVSYASEIYQNQPNSSFGVWNRLQTRGLEGFVYAISPFNFTSIGLNLATAPALMGCVTIWKPAATATLAAQICMELMEEAGLPKGVINLVPGDARMVSDILLKDPNLSGIHFTGSTATFNHLWKEVAANLDTYKTYPRLVGETGGKNYIFAHESADVAQLETALVRAAFEYQGQKCSACSRAYIPKSLWQKLKPRLIATTNALKMGDPEDFTNFVSAVIDDKSFTKISGYIERAKSDSAAEIIAGGECDKSKGYYIRPTIIEVTDPSYATMKDELFGPVLTVYAYDDSAFEETLKECESSASYGLTGAIFAKDRGVIAHMTTVLENSAGNFYINDKPTGAVVGQQPFGGSRASGTNDKAGSAYNLLRWVSHRTIKENFLDITDYRYPFMAEK